MINAEEQKLVERLTHELGEHFESVQVLVSRCSSEGGTERYFLGQGNWFARLAMAQRFVKSDEAEDAAQHIADRLRHGE